MKCPKCSTEASDAARFCPRCHATLRFECPACKNEQRHGGTCDKCGVDFLKYISATVANQQLQAQTSRDRGRRRTGILKGVLLLPIDMGLSLVRNLFRARGRGSA